ncbi:hypothetical protein DFP72DRAFT_1065625 [Ephemerocybe angulata]|uniref:Uncharacterized protein n=1 Tax=Ephemerocybe angulata TaxID=980116 RepID=A0A8H6I5J1_9AGAR|nr:hypothetical protein DFP72DRAFT_1065625 [Tulosesus angulatus]
MAEQNDKENKDFVFELPRELLIIVLKAYQSSVKGQSRLIPAHLARWTRKALMPISELAIYSENLSNFPQDSGYPRFAVCAHSAKEFLKDMEAFNLAFNCPSAVFGNIHHAAFDIPSSGSQYRNTARILRCFQPATLTVITPEGVPSILYKLLVQSSPTITSLELFVGKGGRTGIETEDEEEMEESHWEGASDDEDDRELVPRLNICSDRKFTKALAHFLNLQTLSIRTCWSLFPPYDTNTYIQFVETLSLSSPSLQHVYLAYVQVIRFFAADCTRRMRQHHYKDLENGNWKSIEWCI